ncbi:acyltransferase [Helicobacter sp. 11S02629-2]|uniref:acyltransferase n=1 Tax=Helicobacter sp. 11S02629-2 TaxID=1476195 RepID=UPI000BA79E0A|nr:acyltransferase [Helicobacter sp. 11S02629-2]
MYKAHESSCIDEGAIIGEGCDIGHFCHITSKAKIGKNCYIGQGCMIGSATLGDNVTMANNTILYEGVVLKDNVFIGSGVVFANASNPSNCNGQNYIYKKIVVKKGASVGANTTLIAPAKIGKYAVVGAGSVVTKDIPPFALAFGNPARVVGFVNKKGKKIQDSRS